MKKLLTIIIAMLLPMISDAQTAQGSKQAPKRGESTYKRGDVNEDGKVDIADVITLVDIIAKGEQGGGGGDEPVEPVYSFKMVYEEAFVKRFGMPSPNQNWGFESRTTRGALGKKIRVIAEDLVSNDFDFNDVVFDVEEKDGGLRITLQAVGTTIPMYILGREVHNLFGVAQDVMVNTGSESSTLSPVSFEISANIEDMVVQSEVNVNSLMELWILTGAVPAMIAVNTDYEWCEEGLSIGSKYTRFASWVQGSEQYFYDSSPTPQISEEDYPKKNIMTGIAYLLTEFNDYAKNVEKWYTGIEDNTDFKAPVNPSNRILYEFWASPYSLINRNLNLRNYAEMNNENSVLTLCDILDALAYEELTTYFGDVPYRTPDDDPFSGLPRKSVSVIINNLITSLSQSIAYANDSKGNEIITSSNVVNLASPSSDICSLILAELYISKGDYQSAQTLLAKIISSGHYSLYDNYTRSSMNSNEIILLLSGFDSNEAILRTYTDVILLMAECEYQLGNESIATELLSQIVSAKGMTVNETNTANAIANIRRNLQGQTNGYYAYLKRSGLAKGILGIEDYQLLLPIPLEELNYNQYITQNPGY